MEKKQEIVSRLKAAAINSVTWPGSKSWPELWIGQVEVNSELRYQILDHCNTFNRKVSTSHIQNLRMEMKSGQYDPCTNFLMFTDDNTLADGQHRLEAIPEGSTQSLLVVIGVPPKSRRKIDILHRLRDSVTNRNFAGQQVDGSDRMRYRIANWIGKLHRHAKIGMFSKVPQSEEDIVLRRNRDAIDYVVSVAEKYSAMKARQTICAAFVRMYQLHPSKAKVFINAFFADERGKEGDPVRALLRYMDTIRNVGGGRGATGNSGREGDQYRKANYAINAFIHGRTCASLNPKKCSADCIDGDEDKLWSFYTSEEDPESVKQAA